MTIERFVKQLDGCTYVSGGLNCNCASEAMWLYRASQGTISISSCDVRRRTSDRSGGTNLEQADAVSRQFGITTGRIYKPIDFDSLWSLMQTGRYGAILQIDYSPIAPTPMDCFDNQFTGAHSIFLTRPADASHVVGGDPGADGRRSSIPKGFQTYPKELLRTAGGLLGPVDANGHTVAQRYGPGKVFAYLTPPDPINNRFRVTIAGPVRLYYGVGGLADGLVTSASYICDRTKRDGLWWFTIVSKANGSSTGLRGRAFKPNRYVTAHRV